MKRAALLPAGSDPFLLAHWLRNYLTWSDSVDELVVMVSGHLELEALGYIDDLIRSAPHARMAYYNHRTSHGLMLEALTRYTRAKTVMLCEDDAYIRRPGIVDEAFAFAEAGGIVGTSRIGYATDAIINAATKALGDQHSYWPCFLFVGRDRLLATDMTLGAREWRPGDEILGTRIEQDEASDTFVWASYQLRAMGLPETLHENHRLAGQVVPDDAPWFHVGSLSGGHGYAFMGEMTPEDFDHEIGVWHQLPPGNAAQRIAWWARVWQSTYGAIPDYHRRYGEGLEKLRRMADVSVDEVNAVMRANDRLITWADR